MTSKVEYSDFVRLLLSEMGRRRIGFCVRPMDKNVALMAEVNGKLVAFATLRTARIRKSDILLRGYLPTDSRLSAHSRKRLVPEGRNGYFYKGDENPETTACVLSEHWQDLKYRIQAYEKLHKVKRGERPPRAWAAGIPFSYFNSELIK